MFPPTYISCDYCCYLRAPFQLASLPGFHVAHIPKGNLAHTSKYICKNTWYFVFVAFDKSITHSKACRKRTGTLCETINRTEPDLRDVRTRWAITAKFNKAFFFVKFLFFVCWSSGYGRGGVVWRLGFQSACSPESCGYLYNEARPRERSDRGRFLPTGKKASSYRGAYRVPLFILSVCVCMCV